MKTLLRGLGLGALYGFLVCTAEGLLLILPAMQRRFGPEPLAQVESAVLHVVLGAVLGLLLSPLLGLARGRLLHALGVVGVWCALVRWVELDAPFMARMQFIPPIVALVLLGIALALGRRRPALAAVGAALLFAASAYAPSTLIAYTTPSSAARVATRTPPPGAPDVVVVVLDTVRAANVSTYGYERATAPNLDALADEGALFLDATSPSTWSLPSHASLFTGRYPSAHGAHAEHRFLADRAPTLAQVLGSVGYETVCFTANPWISDGLGLTRGFRYVHQSVDSAPMFAFIHRLFARFGREGSDKGGGPVAEAFARWARERPTDGRPVFAFLNFLEAHFPHHQLPSEFLHAFTDRDRSELRTISMDLMGAQFGGELEDLEAARGPALDMYDGGVLYSDYLLGRVVEALRERGTLDTTVLVVLSDHGELLGEHGDHFGHGPGLYQLVVHVPLLVRYPPRVAAGARVEAPVSTVGVYGTVMDLVGLEPPPTLQVGSLLPAIEGRGTSGPILAELHDPSAMGLGGGSGLQDPMMQTGRRYRLLRDGPLKLVETSLGDAFLFDTAADPGERRNLAEELPEQVARLRLRLADVRAELELPELDAVYAADAAPELDEKTRERLKALGYLE